MSEAPLIAIAHPAPVKKPTQNRIKHCRAMISGEVARDCDHAS